jgi:hemerythrin-like domain-containing protein
MNVTDQLKEEHEAIKTLLKVLETVSQRLETGKEVDKKDLDGILKFIQVFADKCHHGKEEDLLFPALESMGVPREGGPIGMMLMEHDLGRKFVKGMSEALKNLKSGQRDANGILADNARQYIALLNPHIDKENDILYPMADAHLPIEKQKELIKGYERVENEVIGEGKHEEFHHLLDKLKRAYEI